MSKGTDDQLKYEGEIYGRIWAAVIWRKEEKYYQELSNKLFMAAKADIIAEKLANNGKYNKKAPLKLEVIGSWHGDPEEKILQEFDPYQPYTTNLDKFLTELIPDSQNNKYFAPNERSKLKISLIDKYNKLKNDLDDVRVLGVGNNNLQKAAKACKIAIKTIIVISILPAIAAIGLATGGLTPALAGAIAASAGLVGAGATIKTIQKSTDLHFDRESIKYTLKESSIVKNKLNSKKKKVQATL